MGTGALGGELFAQGGLLGVAGGVDFGLGARALGERTAHGGKHRLFGGLGHLGLHLRDAGVALGLGARALAHLDEVAGHGHRQQDRQQASKAEAGEDAARDHAADQVHAQPPRRCLMRW